MLPRLLTLHILALLLPSALLAGEVSPKIVANVQFVRLSEPVDLTVWPLADGEGSQMRIIGLTEYGKLVKELSNRPNVDLLSSPTVTFLSGKTATMSMGQTLAFDPHGNKVDLETGDSGLTMPQGVEEYFSGVKVTLSGEVKDDDQLALTYDYLLNEFEGFVEYASPEPQGKYLTPVFRKTQAQGSVTMTAGTCVAIGGLTTNTNNEFEETIVFLSAKLDDSH